MGGGGCVCRGGGGGGSWGDGVAAHKVGGARGLGGEGQWLQLLAIGGAVSTVAVGGVCVLGVCGSRAGR